MQDHNNLNAMPRTCPPVCHPPNAPHAIAVAGKMTVEETARWIWTFSVFQGWDEGNAYAQSFRENAITGRMLKRLTAKLLEVDLEILNHGHRMEIISAIQHLFPGTSFPSIPVTTGLQSSITGIAIPVSECESTYGSGRHVVWSDRESTGRYVVGSKSSMTQYPVSSYSSTHLTDCVESFNSDVMSDSELSSVSRTRPRPLKLHLIPRANMIRDGNEILRIRNRFFIHGFAVDVKPSENRDRYNIEFQNRKEAKRALEQADVIGYWLVMKRFGATPAHPVRYECLSPCTIKAGKALSGQVIGYLSKGEIVTVNQAKGRRVRLSSMNDKGEVENIGWVTVRTADGQPLLKALDVD